MATCLVECREVCDEGGVHRRLGFRPQLPLEFGHRTAELACIELAHGGVVRGGDGGGVDLEGWLKNA